MSARISKPLCPRTGGRHTEECPPTCRWPEDKDEPAARRARLIAQAPAMFGELSAFRSMCLRLKTGELTVGAGEAGGHVVNEATRALTRIDAILAAVEGEGAP